MQGLQSDILTNYIKLSNFWEKNKEPFFFNYKSNNIFDKI